MIKEKLDELAEVFDGEALENEYGVSWVCGAGEDCNCWGIVECYNTHAVILSPN